MEIVIDSHALFWYLGDIPKLSRRAREYIERSERIIVPSIVLMEILYILEKCQMAEKFFGVLHKLQSKRYRIYPLDIRVVVQSLFIRSDIEMHDRIIIATAQLSKAPIISKDKEIAEYYRETIW